MDIHSWPTYLKFFVQTFFWKKYGSEIPYLPTIWTYVQIFVVFFFDLCPNAYFLSAMLPPLIVCALLAHRGSSHLTFLKMIENLVNKEILNFTLYAASTFCHIRLCSVQCANFDSNELHLLSTDCTLSTRPTQLQLLSVKRRNCNYIKDCP